MKLKKSLLLLSVLCLALMFASVTAYAYPNDPPALEDEDLWINYAADSYAGGTGTQSDPYLISSAEQLAKLAKDVKDGPEISYIREGSYYRLTQDIDLSAHKWYPIGTMLNNTINKSFAGFFDGNSRTISGMRIENDYEPESMNGLFGRIASLADFTSGVKDLTVSGADISVTDPDLTYIGILVGDINCNYHVEFNNVHVSGSIGTNAAPDPELGSLVGGFAGTSRNGRFYNCSADVEITGSENSGFETAGGFVGQCTVDSVFENCAAEGSVYGAWSLGGFAGVATTEGSSADRLSIKNCAADVDVTGYDWNIGGFIGYFEGGVLENCVSYGDVTSSVALWAPHAGGFIGGMQWTDLYNVSNSHAAGAVTVSNPDFYGGGFIGYLSECQGTFSECSFNVTDNPSLKAVGDSAPADAAGVEGLGRNGVLANICEDYYGGHDYSADWTTDKESTCSEPGEKSHHCIRCESRNEVTEIAVVPHSTVKVEAKAPTCTEAGNVEYWRCENCGGSFEDEAATAALSDTSVPALGHNAVRTERREPTASEDGNIEYWHCERCGQYFSDEALTRVISRADTVLAATGETQQPDGGAAEPQTGDGSNPALWLALMLASGAALAFTLLYSRKKSPVG